MIINDLVLCFSDIYLVNKTSGKYERVFSFPRNKSAFLTRIKEAADLWNKAIDDFLKLFRSKEASDHE